MVSLIDYLLAYFIYFLPSLILASLTVIIGLAIYFWGKKKNIKIMDHTIDLFSKERGERISEYKLVEKSTVGRSYLVELKPDLSLKNFLIHFTMTPRHLVISLMASILKKRKDYILIEADPTNKVVSRYQLEILPLSDVKRIKSLVEMLGRLTKIKTGSSMFDNVLGIWVNDGELFKAVFQKEPEIIKSIYAQKNQIIRISYYPLDNPSVRLVAELTKNIHPARLMDILFNITETIGSLGEKGFYTKQIGSLRLVKDETVEKEKSKLQDQRYKI